MNNPFEILRTLDGHLSKPVELTLFGRSALALGYSNPPPEIQELFRAAQPKVLAFSK